VLLGKTEVAQLLKNRRKAALPSKTAAVAPSSPSIPTRRMATLIHVVAETGRGCYTTSPARSVGCCNIEVVLIDTEAHRRWTCSTSRGKGGSSRRDEQDLAAVCWPHLSGTIL